MPAEIRLQTRWTSIRHMIGLVACLPPRSGARSRTFNASILRGSSDGRERDRTVPKTGTASQQLLDALRALHRTHADADGLVTLVYETEVYLATRLD